MPSPIPALTKAMLFAAFTALIQGGVAATFGIGAECDETNDFVDGDCADLTVEILQIVGLGIIPGAPTVVNFLFGAIGIAQRLVILIWIIEQGPFAMIVGAIVGLIAALVAWLA